MIRNRSSSRQSGFLSGAAAGNEGPYTLLFDVWLLARVAQGVLDAAMADTGINADEFALYSLIRVEGPMTPTELSGWVERALSLPPGQQRMALTELERALREVGGLPQPATRAAPAAAATARYGLGPAAPGLDDRTQD